MSSLDIFEHYILVEEKTKSHLSLTSLSISSALLFCCFSIFERSIFFRDSFSIRLTDRRKRLLILSTLKSLKNAQHNLEVNKLSVKLDNNKNKNNNKRQIGSVLMNFEVSS